MHLPSGNQTWLAGKSPNKVEVYNWKSHGTIEMVDFQLPRVITRGYILNQVIFMATGHFPWLSVN